MRLESVSPVILITRIEADLTRLRDLLMVPMSRPQTQALSMLHSDPRVQAVLKLVSEKYCVPEATLWARTRTERVAYARHVAMWLMRVVMGMKSEAVGEVLRRDHTGVLHGQKRIDDLCRTDLRVRTEMEAWRAVLIPGGSVPARGNSIAAAVTFDPLNRGNAQVVKEPVSAVEKTHICLCGNVAVRKKDGSWACARCLKIETRMAHDRREA